VRGALEESGLDVAWCDEAPLDPGTWDAVLREHSELAEKTLSFGVPTIILDGGDGPAIFGPVISDVPTLARYPSQREADRQTDRCTAAVRLAGRSQSGGGPPSLQISLLRTVNDAR
jgi:hypothetical protein